MVKKETREIVKIAHSFGASFEGEIGHVGNAIDGDGVEENGAFIVDC